MKLIQYITALVFLFQFSNSPTAAQTLVNDTLKISFTGFKNIKSDVFIDSIIDMRNKAPDILGKFEKNKYVFIPVDLLLNTETPFCEEIYRTIEFSAGTNEPAKFRLALNRLKLSRQTKSLIYPRYLLNSTVNVYEYNERQKPELLGFLLYESAFRSRPFFGPGLKEGFESVIDKWRKEMVSDLEFLSKNLNSGKTPGLYNFRKDLRNVKQVNMIAGIDVISGTECRMADGEILFSQREAKRRFFRNGYTVRYRNGDSYDSIEFGMYNDYLIHRCSPGIILRAKSQFMVGVNRWNDFETEEHKLWDAVIADYSLSQSIIYNPLDRHSVTFGLGLMENVYYIYSQKIKFQFGLLVNLGLKL